MDIFVKIFNNAGSIIITLVASLWVIDQIWIGIKGIKTRKEWNEYYNEKSNDYRDDSRQ